MDICIRLQIDASESLAKIVKEVCSAMKSSGQTAEVEVYETKTLTEPVQTVRAAVAPVMPVAAPVEEPAFAPVAAEDPAPTQPTTDNAWLREQMERTRARLLTPEEAQDKRGTMYKKLHQLFLSTAKEIGASHGLDVDKPTALPEGEVRISFVRSLDEYNREGNEFTVQLPF